MTCEFYNYQILELKTRTHNEQVDYLRKLCEHQRKETLIEVEKMIDKTYLKKECNCEWFLNELKQQLKELENKTK